MKVGILSAAALAAVSLSACAIPPTPPPTQIGEIGAVQTDPKDVLKQVLVERVGIYPSADASNCKVRTAMTFVRPDGVALPAPALVGPTQGGQIYDIAMGRGVLQIDCQTTAGWETRELETPFNAEEHDDVVAGRALGAAISGGILGVVMAQDQMQGSEYWPAFNFFPQVIHFVSAKSRADAAAMTGIRAAAAKRWDAAIAAIKAQCAAKPRAPQICEEADQAGYLMKLRALDESYLSGATAPAKPAAVPETDKPAS